MSKKFTKAVLSAAMAGVLFGVSFVTMADATTDNTMRYSVYQYGKKQNANNLSSQKFYIKYNPDTKEAKIYFGTQPDQIKMANKELYTINSSGNVVVESDDGKLSFSYYNKDVHDFMSSMGSGSIHNMSEDEIRSLINRVESIKKISVNTDAVLDPLLKIEGDKSAVGKDARATHENSVALGADSVTTRDNEVYIGYKTENGKAYGTRVLGGLSDGTSNSDAATVGQLNRKVGVVYDDVKARITVESEKQKKYTDQKTSEVNEKVESRTLVGVSSDGTLTRAEGAKNTISVNDGLVALSGRTDRIDAAVGAIDGRVTRNTQSIEKNSKAIAANTRTLQQHSARLDSQQRQINENHKEMKRAAAQSAALTGLFQPYSVGKFNATAAVGGYSDQQALAVGVGYRFNEQTAAKAGVAFSDGDASWNVGVNFEF
ncbi:Immunoglobulin-binding protein from prophage P-EibD [Escherichia coli]|uniref:YadA C-terminal domain-containing protein n=1 Tax=Escherichia coli TaxID=562 RepID=UPI000DF87573|nr:YadA C-terminal domain-containing protein [Escherichia coli]STH49333.1 Immunoglobulin-binding protein from prophage P-EibD [Escherichia coli]